jgi:hypothetical protein
MKILHITEIYPDVEHGIGVWGGGEKQFYELLNLQPSKCLRDPLFTFFEQIGAGEGISTPIYRYTAANAANHQKTIWETSLREKSDSTERGHDRSAYWTHVENKYIPDGDFLVVAQKSTRHLSIQLRMQNWVQERSTGTVDGWMQVYGAPKHPCDANSRSTLMPCTHSNQEANESKSELLFQDGRTDARGQFKSCAILNVMRHMDLTKLT